MEKFSQMLMVHRICLCMSRRMHGFFMHPECSWLCTTSSVFMRDCPMSNGATVANRIVQATVYIVWSLLCLEKAAAGGLAGEAAERRCERC